MSKGLATEDMIASPVDAADALWRLSWRSLEGKWVVSSGCVSVQTPHSDCTCIQNTFRKHSKDPNIIKIIKYIHTSFTDHDKCTQILISIAMPNSPPHFQVPNMLGAPLTTHCASHLSADKVVWGQPTWKFEQHLSRDNMAMIGHGWYRPDMDADNTSSMVSFVIFLTLA